MFASSCIAPGYLDTSLGLGSSMQSPPGPPPTGYPWTHSRRLRWLDSLHLVDTHAAASVNHASRAW